VSDLLPQLTLDKLENPERIEDMLLSYAHDEELKDSYINLVSTVVVNTSHFSVKCNDVGYRSDCKILNDQCLSRLL
jgi:hypothetical protein